MLIAEADRARADTFAILDSHLKELIELLKYDGRENLVADVALTGETLDRYGERTRLAEKGRAVTPQAKRDVVERLLSMWLGYSEQRLGQLLVNVSGSRDLYYIEDTKLAELVERWEP